MSPAADLVRDDSGRSFIAVLQQIDTATGPEGLAVAGIVDRLDERAFGLLMLVLILPCLVPGLPGAQVIAIPIFLLAAQIMLGRHEPWLPGWFMRLRVEKGWISAIAQFADKRLRWTEALSRPRLTFLASGLGERFVAFFMLLAAITVMLPITNTIPSVALSFMALGLIQRDGLFALAGVVVATIWLAALGTVIAGLVLGAGFAVELVRDAAPWLLEWLGR